jgi:membrane fusion protein (multidrug efflux system)
MIARLFTLLLLLALVFGGIFGWKAFVRHQTQQQLADAKPPTVTISSALVEQDDWQAKVSAVGSLRAIQGVDVSSEVPGTVASISFESGHRVAEGDPLVHLDATAEKAERRSLEAQLELARLDYERAKGLQRKTALSQAQLDRAKSVLDSLAAQAEEQEALIAKKTVRAPFAGELGIRQVNLGEYVSAGTAIVTLQALDPIHADFTLPERYLRDLTVGQTVEVEVAAYPEELFIGSVTAISPRVEKSTRTVILQARLENPDRRLRPGMFARVALLIRGIESVLTLPRSAISFFPYGNSVFVIEADGEDLIVERRQVTTGRIRAGRVEIVAGLEPGQRVVSAGQLKLRNGQRVRINNSVELPSGSLKG